MRSLLQSHESLYVRREPLENGAAVESTAVPWVTQLQGGLQSGLSRPFLDAMHRPGLERLLHAYPVDTTGGDQPVPPTPVASSNSAFLNSFFIFFSVFACALTLLLCLRLMLRRNGSLAEDEEGGQGRNRGRNQRARGVQAKTGLEASLLALLPRRLVTAETKFLTSDVMPQEECIVVVPDVKEAALLESAGAIPKECAVCLSDYEEGDVVRWLPSCGHTFHGACIEEWLDSKTTCPICRVDLEPLLRASGNPLQDTVEESAPGPADCNPSPQQAAAVVVWSARS